MTIRTPVRALTALALLAGAGAASAQDSVSRNANGGNGLPGDSISPWASGTGQRTNYVVDLTPFTTASGVPFGIAPIAKSSKTSAARFTALNGPSMIGQTTVTGGAYPNATYTLWTAAGGGVNSAENNTTLNSTVTPQGNASVLGFAFLDFDEVTIGAAQVFVNQVAGGFLAFNPDQPSRLFVTRQVAAVNNTLNQLDRSQFGLGGVDSSGNVYIRADSFGATGPATTLLQGDNYFRIRLPDRSGFANLIDNSGASNSATADWLLVRDAVTHTVPNAFPRDRSTRPVLLGSDLLGGLRHESAAGVLSTTTAHRPGTSDQRGGVTCSGAQVFAGTLATGATLARSSGGGGKTDSLSVFGLGDSGQVLAARTLTIPASIPDACDAFVWPLSGGEFRNYESQVTFRGGSGPVSVTRDQSGRGLAAAVLYSGLNPGAANPTNALVACRFDPANPQSTPEWTSVAWVDAATGTGKSIRGDYGADGAPGTGDAGEGDGVVDATDAPIGRLAALSESSLGLDGPSLSAPAFDAAGNVYFTASVALKRRVGQQIVLDHELALLRAAYDPATFCYTLDLVLRGGDVLQGQNSSTPYRVESLNVADSDSVSSASLWSGSASQTPWNAIDNATLDAGDPAHLGGLVLSARIVYDTDANGQFTDPTRPGNDPNSPDEAYNVVLYVGNVTPPALCIADYNNSGGTPDDADVAAFFFDWNAGEPRADVNRSGGTPDDADIAYFFQRWNAGC